MNISPEEIAEDFFDLTASDLKHLLSELKKVQTNEEMLETKEQRENRLLLERKRYKKTILRVIFPDDKLVLQLMFTPEDLINDVFKIVTKYTQHSDIHLFVVPPKTILSMESNLYDLKLVPCGTIYCASNKSDRLEIIREEFKNNIYTFSQVTQYAFNRIKIENN